NAANGLDALADGHIVPSDALVIINYVNAFGTVNSGRVPALGATLPTTPPITASYGGPFGYLDVNGDNFVVPGDALLVINYVNAFGASEGEACAGVNALTSAASDDLLLTLLAYDV